MFCGVLMQGPGMRVVVPLSYGDRDFGPVETLGCFETLLYPDPKFSGNLVMRALGIVLLCLVAFRSYRA